MSEQGQDSFLWYACYGSNLLQGRFLARLRGDTFPATELQQTPSNHPMPPERSKGVLILHRLMFAGMSDLWDGGGVAFIREEMDPEAKTLGRMYLISRPQFREIILKENRMVDSDGTLALNLEEIRVKGGSRVAEGSYDTVLYLGEDDGYPIFTFTASWPEGPAPIHPPAARYLSVVARGLRETYRLSDEGIVEYLRNVPGIEGALTEGDLARIVRDAADPYPNSFT